MKKISAVLLSVTLLLSLAALFSACGRAEPADAQTTAAGEDTTAESLSPTETTEEAATTAAPEETPGQEQATEEQTTGQAQSVSEQPVEPKSDQEILAMYNRALAASGTLKRTAYRRSIAAGGLWRASEPEAVLDLAKEAGMPALIAVNDTQQAPNDLTALDASLVKSLSYSQENGKEVITIQLRDASRPT